jgi:hypothetical protein
MPGKFRVKLPEDAGGSKIHLILEIMIKMTLLISTIIEGSYCRLNEVWG